jgi:hypothetical protein
MPRRRFLETVLAAVGGFAGGVATRAPAAPPEISLPDTATTERFDFDIRGIEDWTVVDGQWAVEEIPGAQPGTKALVQHATKNAFNVILAPGVWADVDVSVKFRPIAGRTDASGGIVFRFHDDTYYVVRANALEDNFRLYVYDHGRRQLAGVSGQRPALKQWHTLRVVAVGGHIQASLNEVLRLDHHDSRLGSGRVGLWTKAESVTAFDELSIRGTKGV